MTKQKTWLRPTQISRTFPTKKYDFSTHLTQVGDWVETESLNAKERKNFVDAAWAWAWNKGYTVKTSSQPAPEGGWYVKATLVKKHRYRDYA